MNLGKELVLLLDWSLEPVSLEQQLQVHLSPEQLSPEQLLQVHPSQEQL
jgi:hypothetical protein